MRNSGLFARNVFGLACASRVRVDAVNLKGIRANNLIVDKFELFGWTFSDTIFTDFRMLEGVLSDCTFEKLEFRSGAIEKSKMFKCTGTLDADILREVEIVRAKLSLVGAGPKELDGCSISRSEITLTGNVYFKSCYARNARFSVIPPTNSEGGDASTAFVIELQNTQLYGCILRAGTADRRLRVRLSDCSIKRCIFSGIVIDGDTASTLKRGQNYPSGVVFFDLPVAISRDEQRDKISGPSERMRQLKMARDLNMELIGGRLLMININWWQQIPRSERLDWTGSFLNEARDKFFDGSVRMEKRLMRLFGNLKSIDDLVFQ